MTQDNIIDFMGKDDTFFSVRMHYATDAKAFGRWIWNTGAVAWVEVINKKDQVVFTRGEKA